MGIHLDWEVEAEQTHTQRAGEEPLSARKRRLARLRFLLFILVLLGIFAGLAGVVVWRLQTLDSQVEQALRSTVEAEVAALRLGDFAAFSSAQRSASGDWLQSQQQLFNQYQDLKLQQSLELTGQILDVKVDRTRARVTVQEIIGGIPYARLWFYWRYEDGWRHVPPDYTFWGEVHTESQPDMTIRYQDVDALVAQAMQQQLPGWMQLACSALQCPTIPPLTIDIVPDETLQPSWVAGAVWQLQMPSPYVGRARADMPFDLDTQFAVANLLAERLITESSADLQPQYPADVYYLRQGIVSWLVGRFVQVNTNSFLVNSLATNYGDPLVGQLLSTLRPASSIAVLSEVIGKPLEQSGLDWRDYLTWRLRLEEEFIQSRDEANFLALYDTLDEAARNLAYQRFSASPAVSDKVVISLQSEVSADGSPTLRAVVQTGEGATVAQEEVVFRLVAGLWKRLN
jgi:hypothetical protein